MQEFIMRKPVSILLAFIFLFNIGGHYLWFAVLQKSIKEGVEKQITKGLKEEALSIVTVPVKGETGINWIKPGKEFRYRGEMYDVVYSKIEGQDKLYFCINDNKEKQLIAAYHKANNSKKDTDKRIKSNLTDRYIPQQLLLSSTDYPTDMEYPAKNISFSSTILKIPSPPPKRA
jgi:hypothetical protein